MGTTPTHEPCEGDTTEGDEPPAGRSLPGRVVGVVRSVVDGVRRQLSVFSKLDFGRAFQLDEADLGAAEPTTKETTELVVANDPDESTHLAVPRREQPLTYPARDEAEENTPDLQSSVENGQLSIYYPGESDAQITSDTYAPVER